MPSGGLDHGSDVGIELRTPLGAEAVRHLAEHHAGVQGLLGPVVGRWQVGVGDEDEQGVADAVDGLSQLISL